ncbi:MAG: alpha-2-macroglobulin family protein [Alphaproteobacteria bacterium]|jgi:uncharacterized protein YfaS (alpha-2-macroglobulin family)|nr:alpha-2-macroglobulin family protein [Alphaproteobacteria bacterium]
MRLSLIFVFVFNILFSLPGEAAPYTEWEHQNAKEYVKILTEAAAKANKGQNQGKGKEDALKRINEAKSQEKWGIAIAELEALVGQNPEDLNLWLDLAFTGYRGAQEGKPGYYEIVNKAERAAAYVYFTSKDTNQRALALLISAAVSGYGETREKCLAELATLVDIKKLREANLAYKDLAPFVFKEHLVDRDSNTPQVCFTFSHPLPESFKPADYFEVTPKIDGAFHVRNTKICLTGIRFGENYNVTVREGIPSLFGEKTTQTSKISFLVDDKSPRLSFPKQTYILQKNDQQMIPLTAVNVKRVEVKVVRVNDRSFVEGFGRPHHSLEDEISAYTWNDIANRYGEPLYSGAMDIGGEPNKNITKQIPLNAIVKDLKPGAYGIFVKDAASKDNYSSPSASQWVLVTDIGMTVFKGTTGLDINTRSLSTAQGMSKIDVHLLSYNNQILATQKSNPSGFVHFDAALLRGKGGNRPAFVFAYGVDGNFAALKLSDPAFDLSDRGVEGRKVPGTLDAFLYTERGVYRPGETVRVNGLLRNFNAQEVGATPLTFRLMRPDEVVAQSDTVVGNAHGYYDLNLPLSPSARTGQWTVQVFVDPKGEPIGETKFSVEDFVPTRLLVTLKSPEALFVFGKSLPVDVVGRYLFGAAASGLGGDASLVIRRHPNPFPMFSGYQFGLLDDKFTTTRTDFELAPLNEEGKGTLTVTTDAKPEATVPLQAVIQAAVRDAGGRPQLGTLRLDVQSFPYMIGIKGNFKNGAIDFQDKVAEIEIITLSPKGEQVAEQNLHYTLYAEETFYNWAMSDRGGAWEYKPVREDKLILENDFATAKEGITKLSLPIEGWGYYRLEVKDPKGGAISSFRFTKGHLSSDAKKDIPDKLTVKQDKSSYAIGETVRLRIESPFDGEGLLVVANQDVIETRNIKVSKAGTEVTLKAAETWGTGAYVLVSGFRPLGKLEKDPLQNAMTPKRAVGLSWVALSPEPRTLKVTLSVPKEIKPRQKVDLPLHVDGTIKSDTFVTVAAVDEGILMLTDFKTPKPQDYFLGKRTLGVEMRDLYGKILDAMPGEMGELRSGGDEGILARNLAALSKRSFRIVSLFQGPISLDAKGNATVPIEIPDFNGTLRLMVVAFNQSSIGSGDAQLLVRDPIVSEPVFPRFLGVGDTSQMSLSLFNPSETKKTVKLSVKAEGSIGLEDQAETVTLEKDGAWHTQIPLKGKSIGDGVVTLFISGDGFEPILRSFEMTVRPSTPPTSIKATLLLQPGDTKSLDLKDQQAVLPATAKVIISASDQIPWDLTTILSNLMTYPYGCVEQTVSRGFAVLYKKQMGILKDSETLQDLDKALFKVFSILAEKQDREGGFPLWSIFESASDPWITAYAFDFMQQSKALGFKVPENTFENTAQFLRNFVKSQSSNSSAQKLAEASYAASLLAGQDILEDGAIRYFFDTYFEKLSHPLSRAQVGQALSKIGDVARAKRAFEGISIQEDKDPKLLPYGTAIRNKAALIKVLIGTMKIAPTLTDLGDIAQSQIKILGQSMTPSNPLSTQEQAWLLRAGQALTTSLKGAVEKIQLAVNDKILEKERVVSETLDEVTLAKGVVLSNKGKSPLWVNTVLYGFPKEAPAASEKGLKVKRTYYTLGGQEVTINPKTVLAQGDQLIVVLQGELLQEAAPEQVNYMLVVDWLPAGFEIESGRFGTPPPTPEEQEKKSAPKYPWDELTRTLTSEARDDRYVAALKLSESAKSFTLAYRVRAVTPGTYQYSGLHVEDMFVPTIYANTPAGKIEIQAKEIKAKGK